MSYVKTVCDQWLFVCERGSVGGKLHWHIFMKLKEKVRKSRVINMIANHFGERIPRKEDIDASPVVDNDAFKNYITKGDDTLVEGPYSSTPIYMGRDILCLEQTPFPWQESIIHSVSAEPDDRTIHWISEPDGSVGKSKLAKYLAFKHGAHILSANRADQLKSAVCQRGASRLYIADIPRTTGKEESTKELISAIEAIKNGMVMSAFYGKHSELYMEPPHVIVFSNEAAPKHLMSADRWKCLTIDKDSLKLEEV